MLALQHLASLPKGIVIEVTAAAGIEQSGEREQVFFFSSHLFSASRKVTASGVTGKRSAGREAACSDRPFRARVSEELMKLGFAVVAVGLARQGQLKEGAGEGAPRRHCEQRSPAGDPCCPGRGSQMRWDSCSPVARKQAEESGCFSTEAPPNLKPDHDKAAAPCPLQFRIHALPPAPGCRGDAVARLDVSPWVGFPCTRQRRHKGGIEGELRTVPQGEPVGDHFNLPVIGDGHINVHVRDTHIPRDASATLTANARPLVPAARRARRGPPTWRRQPGGSLPPQLQDRGASGRARRSRRSRRTRNWALGMRTASWVGETVKARAE